MGFKIIGGLIALFSSIFGLKYFFKSETKEEEIDRSGEENYLKNKYGDQYDKPHFKATRELALALGTLEGSTSFFEDEEGAINALNSITGDNSVRVTNYNLMRTLYPDMAEGNDMARDIFRLVDAADYEVTDWFLLNYGIGE